MLSTIANIHRPSARPTLGRSRTNRQYAYGCTSLWEVIERIQLAAGLATSEQLLTTHVYGLGIDDEVSCRVEDVALPEDVWTHRDDLGSLTSITDDAGLVLERYEYGDYGRVTIFDTNGDVLPSSQYAAVHLYTGRLMIAGTGLYDYRWRTMDPWTGRFNQRDPLWYIDSMNAYAYVMSNPHGYGDPFGLHKEDNWYDLPSELKNNKDFRQYVEDSKADMSHPKGKQLTRREMLALASEFAEHSKVSSSTREKIAKALRGMKGSVGGLALVGVSLYFLVDDAAGALSDPLSPCRRLLNSIDRFTKQEYCNSSALDDLGEKCKWDLMYMAAETSGSSASVLIKEAFEKFMTDLREACAAHNCRSNSSSSEGNDGTE